MTDPLLPSSNSGRGQPLLSMRLLGVIESGELFFKSDSESVKLIVWN